MFSWVSVCKQGEGYPLVLSKSCPWGGGGGGEEATPGPVIDPVPGPAWRYPQSRSWRSGVAPGPGPGGTPPPVRSRSGWTIPPPHSTRTDPLAFMHEDFFVTMVSLSRTPTTRVSRLLIVCVFLPPAYVVRREGNVLTRVCPSICLSTGGYPYPIMLCNITVVSGFGTALSNPRPHTEQP